MIEENAQGDQPENPIQDGEREQQAGDTIENPQDKATPTEGAKMDNMMRMMMEQFGQINDNFKKQEEKINENSRRQNEILSEDLTKQLREDIETLNNKIECNKMTLKQQINKKIKEHSDTLQKNQ